MKHLIKSTLFVTGFLFTGALNGQTADDPTLSVSAAAAKHATYTYNSWGQFVQRWKILNQTGLRLIDLEVLSKSGTTSFTGVWTKGGGKYALYRYKSWSDFVKKWKDLNEDGQRLIDVDRLKIGSTYWYYGVWRGGSGKYALYKYSS